MNKLDINLQQFKKMRAVDRDEIIYQNLVHIKKKLGDYKLHKKVQYVWLAALTMWMGIKKYIGF